jgi:predicted transcriptional regulator of viral defense system
MLKNKLSHLEQDVYFTLLNKTNKLFTIDLIRQFELADDNTLKEVLSNMVKKGWLIRIKNGVYYLSENGNGQIDDIFRVATYAYSGYIGFSSALYLYNAITERPYTAFVATRKISKSKLIGNMEIRAIALGKRAIGGVRYKEYYISSKSKSIYDCFHLPEYAGGYSKVLEAISSIKLNSLEWEEFIKYLDLFETDGAKRKIGYMLEMLNTARRTVPKSTIDRLRVGGPIIKLGEGRKSRFSREWNVADYLGESYFLGWSK